LTTMSEKTGKVFLLGGEAQHRFHFRRPVSRLHNRKGIAAAIAAAVKLSGVWIATKREATDELLREAFHPCFLRVPHHGRHLRQQLGRLLILYTPRPESIPVLEELFTHVAWGTTSFKTLQPRELAEVVMSDNRHNLVIGGFVDPQTETLTLYRGDFEKFSVPLSVFKPSGTGIVPDASALELTDYGQTVRFGNYEAATDAILYEVDSDFRRAVNAKRREEDKTFGARLRRLRKLKGLRQSDFDLIPAKTIARIERGETQEPHGKTLQLIAECLGVEPDEIMSY
jgi:Helix-turn-helix